MSKAPEGSRTKRICWYIEPLNEATEQMLFEQIGEEHAHRQLMTESGVVPLCFSTNPKKLGRIMRRIQGDKKARYELYRQISGGSIENRDQLLNPMPRSA